MNAMKLALPLFVALACGPSSALAGPILTANLASFAVLAATGVTNVPVSIIGGNLGSAVNPSVGGGYIFTAGSFQQNTPLAQQAQVDLDAAIVALSAFGVGTTITGGDLDAYQFANGGTIIPGTYTVPAQPVNLAGTLILDAQGLNNAFWVFQIGSTLTTASAAVVQMINVGSNGGSDNGLFWQVEGNHA